MGPLAQIYSAGDTLKRQFRGLLDEPLGTLQQFVNHMNDRSRSLNELTTASANEFRQTKRSGGPQTEKLAGVLADAYNPAGMVVWHGSPHKFNKFDSSKIGTGEGAQAYGHGLYLAESPTVATEYKNRLGSTMAVDGKPLLTNGRLTGSTGNAEFDGLLELYGGDLKQAMRDQLGIIRDRRHRLSLPEAQTEMIQKLNTQALKNDQKLLAEMRGLRSAATVKNEGSLYKVDLPDEQITKMLDWDKPLSQQAPEVQAFALKNAAPLKKQVLDSQKNPLNEGDAYKSIYDLTGQSLVNALGQGGRAENALKQAGIPGIRYLDGSSRGTGQGTSNFVVFPGNEGLLSILERNGQPLP
jgi:hypothetical protein